MKERIFKTAWFSRAARKALISDAELCRAIGQVLLGLVDDLGGGVFKKRLSLNDHRSILLAKIGEFWVFTYLFAKKDRANIDREELIAFRKLAELYRTKSPSDLSTELDAGILMEICHDR